MKIKLFCFFYNEAALLPYFLTHYRWVDVIHAVVSRSPDGTNELLRRAQALGQERRVPKLPRLEIEDWEFPDGKMDDFLKVAKLNEVINRKSDADWHMVVDADELVWDKLGVGLTQRGLLMTLPARDTVMMARMWNVFRHVTDNDLDPEKEPVFQRRHGIADLEAPENAQYQKPVLTRPNLGFSYVPGNHNVEPNQKYQVAQEQFVGVHWQNADPSFCVERRIQGRRDRQSEVNKRFGLGAQHHSIREEDVRRLCRQHENDPLCF